MQGGAAIKMKHHKAQKGDEGLEPITQNNSLTLVGTPAGRPALSHSCRGERFYLLPLRVRRLSGTEDELPVLLRERLLEALELREAEKLRVRGELRSFNLHRENGIRLLLTVFARSADFFDGEDENRLLLRGALCRAPTLRRTPLGRDICDLMLAVNRPYARSDYLPCICWGRNAKEAARWPVGTAVQLAGRLQSRRYLKMTADGPLARTAYEVSAAEIEQAE